MTFTTIVATIPKPAATQTLIVALTVALGCGSQSLPARSAPTSDLRTLTGLYVENADGAQLLKLESFEIATGVASISMSGDVVTAVLDRAALASTHRDPNEVRIGFVLVDAHCGDVEIAADGRAIPSHRLPTVDLGRMRIGGSLYSRWQFSHLADAQSADVVVCGTRTPLTGDGFARVRALAKAANGPVQTSESADNLSRRLGWKIRVDACQAKTARIERRPATGGSAAVACTVRDPAGKPLAGVTVAVEGSSTQADLSDADGRCAMGGLQPGEYSVRFYFANHKAEIRATLAADTITHLEAVVGTTLSGPIAAFPSNAPF